jgi:hypothetical protein
MVFAPDRIWANSYFKPTITEEKNLEIEAYMIHVLDSLRMGQSERPFYKYPKVEARYTLNNLPCIKIYLLDTGVIEYGEDFESNYQYVFFSECDSSIYHLRGGIDSFSKIVRQFLATKLDKNNSLSLIDLYLNTQSFSYPYYIIGSYEDFSKVDPASGYFSENEFKNDSTIVSNVVKPPEINETKGQIDVKIYTWEQSTGDIDFWYFRISNQNMEIIETHTTAEQIGRYQKWRGVK